MDSLETHDMPEQPPTEHSDPTDHPVYKLVETAIEQGEWHAAQAPIAELLGLYPDDDDLQELAAAVRARTALLGTAPEVVPAPTRSPIVSRGLKLIIPIVILIALLCMAVGAFVTFRWWIIPQATMQRQQARVDQLRQEAQAAMTSGDYERAVLAFNELLQILPDDRQALDGLKQANEIRGVVSLYSEAIAEMTAHHWDNALSLLQQIEGEQSGYRDVADRIGFVQKQQELSDRFSKAEAAFDQDNYELAVKEYEALQSVDYSFQSETVQKRLFFSYLQLGLAEEKAAGSDPQGLRAALNKFDRALSLRPEDSQAKGESKLLRSYLAGLDEFNDGNWPEVVSLLMSVYEARPDFANGSASQLLYNAYVAWGDELFADSQFEQAQAKYREARLIQSVDSSKLDVKIALVREALITPTPEPTPTAAAVASRGAGSISAPAPTPTPELFPYTLTGMSIRNNCSGHGYIHGVVWNAYNLPLAGVTVQAINTSSGLGPIISNPTNIDGIYQIVLNEDQIEGLWAVQVLENGQPVSQPWGQRLGGGCINGAQELKIDWQRALQLD